MPVTTTKNHEQLIAAAARQRAYYAKNKEKCLARHSAWAAENRERVRANNKAYRDRSPAAAKASTQAYAQAHRAEKRRYSAQYDRDNSGAKLYRTRLRQAAIKRATPPWADLDAIKAIYVEAARRRKGGEDVHVDHIMPLQGRGLCGLHVHYNLRIICAEENLRKSNRVDN
jgi:5-methylcytosine-specific restriction endonuclease McrA